MYRVKIRFPAEDPLFTCKIPVRITDVNYGNHLGNDALLSIIHEARMQLLSTWGYTELDAGGNSLIMGDVMIAYRSQAFYGDELVIKIFALGISAHSFDLLYQISAQRGDASSDIAHAKTGMVCFDYASNKISPLSEELKSRLQCMGN